MWFDLFLIYITDIADETIGLCRLFADNTSIGEKSYKINSLCNMVNTDLKHISQWCKQWLVKLNPTKTDIFYFNTTDIPQLSFRRTATCLDVFAIIVFMWFDHFQSALKVIPKCL
jgi:hypothetical protein